MDVRMGLNFELSLLPQRPKIRKSISPKMDKTHGPGFQCLGHSNWTTDIPGYSYTGYSDTERRLMVTVTLFKIPK